MPAIFLSSAVPISDGTRFQMRMAKTTSIASATQPRRVEAERGRLGMRARARRPVRRWSRCAVSHGAIAAFTAAAASPRLTERPASRCDHVARRLGRDRLDVGERRIGRGADPRLGRLDLAPALSASAAAHPLLGRAGARLPGAPAATFIASARLASMRAR